MDDGNPMVANGETAQVNDPEIGQAGGDHQVTQSGWIGEMTFVQEKAATFLVGEKGFDLEAFFVPVQGFMGQIKVGDQVQRVGVPAFPGGNHRHGTVAFLSKPDLRDADEIIDLEAQFLKRKQVVFFKQFDIFGGAAHVAPTFALQRRLQCDAIEFAIAQEDHLGTFRQNGVKLVEQL